MFACITCDRYPRPPPPTCPRLFPPHLQVVEAISNTRDRFDGLQSVSSKALLYQLPQKRP
jgi:hypothetical protein